MAQMQPVGDLWLYYAVENNGVWCGANPQPMYLPGGLSPLGCSSIHCQPISSFLPVKSTDPGSEADSEAVASTETNPVTFVSAMTLMLEGNSDPHPPQWLDDNGIGPVYRGKYNVDGVDAYISFYKVKFSGFSRPLRIAFETKNPSNPADYSNPPNPNLVHSHKMATELMNEGVFGGNHHYFILLHRGP